MINISFIIPAYNSESTIVYAIDSILKQSKYCSKFEVILVDNASSDKTTKTARDFDITIITCSDSGAAAARNCGARVAKYQWLAFVDSDVILSPNWLKEFIPDIKDKAFLIFNGPVIPVGEDNWFLRFRYKLRSFYTHSTFLSNYPQENIVTANINSASFIINKKLFNLVGGFDINYKRLEDFEFSNRCFSMGASIKSLSKPKSYVLYSPGWKGYLKRYFLNGYYEAKLFRLRRSNIRNYLAYNPFPTNLNLIESVFYLLLYLLRTLGGGYYYLKNFYKNEKSIENSQLIENLIVNQVSKNILKKYSFSLPFHTRILMIDKIQYFYNFKNNNWTKSSANMNNELGI